MNLVTRGQTRVVLLWGPYAVKVARPGIAYCLRRLAALVSAGRPTATLRSWQHDRGGILKVVASAPFYGIIANILEYRMSRRHPDAELARTLWTVGLVNLQRRGHDVTEADVTDHPVVAAVRQVGASTDILEDTVRPEQFCTVDGRLQMVDYGNPRLWECLRTVLGAAGTAAHNA